MTYLAQLDGLRALAAFSVLFSHFLPYTPANYLWLQGLGAFGIYVLFIMSGFLITGILLRCRKGVEQGGMTAWWAARQFYIRRVLRVFPLYYGTLAGAWLLAIPDVRENLAWHALFGTNVLAFVHDGFAPGFTGHLWTIAVEIQFYLLWPWLILFLPRAWIFWVVAGLGVVGPLIRVVMTTFEAQFFVVMFPSCLDALSMGALLALTADGWARAPLSRQRLHEICLRVGLPLWVVMVLVRGFEVVPHAAWNSSQTAVLWHFSMALFGGWLLGRTAEGFGGFWGRVLTFGPLAYCGRIGYGLYILHMFLIPILPPLFVRVGLDAHLGWAGNPFVLLVATIIVASVSWKLMEEPVNNLKRYFPYRGGRE